MVSTETRGTGPSALVIVAPDVQGSPMDVARRFFRAIETPTGWHCHVGSTRLDRHDELDEAVAHLSELGVEHAPSELFAHYLDGAVVSVATFD